MQFPDARILIFAKAPDPGLAKTRLVPVLGEFHAAALSEAMLRDAVTRRVEADLAPVDLYCTPDPRHPVFKSLDALPDVTLYEQCAGDLGDRMQAGLQQALESSSAVLLTGTDTPALETSELARALTILQADPKTVVLSPAEDGGYALLGLAEDCPALFEDMPWGSDQVRTLTLQRCAQAGRPVAELSMTWDVDRPEDLERLRALPGWDQHFPSE